MTTEFGATWQRIRELQGQEFHQKTGRAFTYTAAPGSVVPSTANRQLARSQFAKAFERSPLRGPGQLQDLQGPSYLYAILADPRVASIDSRDSFDEHRPAIKPTPFARPADHVDLPSHDAANRGATGSVRRPRVLSEPAQQLLLGRSVSAAELAGLGFQPLDLRFGRTDVPLPGGIGCEWSTVGDVPDGPGLYAFTIERPDEITVRVVYVGMTEHLWMVTKGQLPRDGGARGGQRYGRPTHAGGTRVRVNIEVRRALEDGWTVRHWVHLIATQPSTKEQSRTLLRAEEEALIARWQLRRAGWNRG